MKNAETDMNVTTPATGLPIDNRPTITNGTAVYTISMDLKFKNRATKIANIVKYGSDHNGVSPNSNLDVAQPFIYVAGTTDGWTNGQTYVGYEHWSISGTTSVQTGAPPVSYPTDTYFNITMTCDGSKLKIYLNGKQVGSDAPGNFKFNTTTSPWTLGEKTNTTPTEGYHYIKNLYFWNKVLSSSDITTLSAPYSTSSPTTSTYEPEPVGYSAYI
jgi:hypothetical protein